MYRKQEFTNTGIRPYHPMPCLGPVENSDIRGSGQICCKRGLQLHQLMLLFECISIYFIKFVFSLNYLPCWTGE